ncbi:MAG TPA: hypothetical protein VI916_02650 [Acidimicrobiia bacterium]|nr:hypothetical protein [Acidimicrobiia bacterium]
MAVAQFRVDSVALAKAIREQGRLPQVMQPLAARCTRETKRVARERTTRRTGRMEAGYRSSTVVGGSGPVVGRIRVENPVAHAAFQEYGTRGPYRIPRSGETWLAFTGRGGRRVVMFGHVMHPGLKAKNIIRDAIRAVAQRRAS